MLYVCPTPIGNLEDITLRVLRVLKEVDLVLAEDTRRTGQLLHHFQINKPLSSFHEHNEREKCAAVIESLKQGKSIALTCDAGMPGISDPGAFLIKRVIDESLPLEVLPGANAALLGYILSGLLEDHFLYYGFLPRRAGARLKSLQRLKTIPYPIVFYEAPHRLGATLKSILEIFGDREISVSRELTKRYEETRRGRVSELAVYFQANRPRGEFVLTVAGALFEVKQEQKEDDIIQELQELIRGGLSRKTAISQLSTKYRLPKNQVYRLALSLNGED